MYDSSEKKCLQIVMWCKDENKPLDCTYSTHCNKYFTLSELNWEKGDRVDDMVEGLGADKISDETGFCVLGFNWDLEY